jgi:hypothetical protein
MVKEPSESKEQEEPTRKYMRVESGCLRVFRRNRRKVRAGDGLEPATACLEGRWSHDHRLLGTNGLYRLIKGCFLVFKHARQKFSHAFFAPTGKSFHVVLHRVLTRVCTYEHYTVLFQKKAKHSWLSYCTPNVKVETSAFLSFSSFHSSDSRSTQTLYQVLEKGKEGSLSTLLSRVLLSLQRAAPLTA